MHVKVIATNGNRMDDVFVIDVIDGPSQPTPQSDCILRLTPQMQSVSQVWRLIRDLVPNHHDWLHLFNVNSYWQEDGYRYQVTLDQDRCSDSHHGFESKLRSLGLHFHKIRIIKSDWNQNYDYRRHRRRHAQIQPTPTVDWSPYASTSIIQSASQLEEHLIRPVPSLASPSLMASASLFPSMSSDLPSESTSPMPWWATLYSTPLYNRPFETASSSGPALSKILASRIEDLLAKSSPTPTLPPSSVVPTSSLAPELIPSVSTSETTETDSPTVVTGEAETSSPTEGSSTPTPTTGSSIDTGTDGDGEEGPNVVPDNSKPQVRRRIQKLALTSGTWFKFAIPEDIFEDREEGSTSQLKLSFYLSPPDWNKDSRVPPGLDYWIQLNQENQFLYGLPTEQDVGSYKYILTAADSAGAFVEETIDVVVRQNRAFRTFHHWFTMHSVTWDMTKYPVYVHAAEKMLSRIAQQAFGDSNLDAIYVRSLKLHVDPAAIDVSWTNKSLPVQPCPRELIDNYFSLLADKNHQGKYRGQVYPPSNTLKQLLIVNEFSVDSIELEFENVCKNTIISGITSDIETRNPIGPLQIPMGPVFRYKLPIDVFFSPNFDQTGLDIDLLDIDGKLLPLDGNIGYKKETMEIWALAIPPVDKNVQELMLYAKEPGGGSSATLPFSVEFVPPVDLESPSLHESFYITMGFIPSSDDTNLILDSRISLIMRLATTVMGDVDASNILIKSFKRLSFTKRRVSRELPQSSPYYEIVWTNSSLRYRDSCPYDAIESAIIDRLFNPMKHETTAISSYFEPEYTVVSVSLTPLGNCTRLMSERRLGKRPEISTATETPPTDTSTTSTNQPGVSVGTPGEEDDERRYYMSSILPALITLVVMLVVALCVVCFLVRYRRSQEKRGQYEVYAGRSETDAFLLKGRTPAILEQELHHHPQQQCSPYGYPYAPQVVMPPHHQNVQVNNTFFFHPFATTCLFNSPHSHH